MSDLYRRDCYNVALGNAPCAIPSCMVEVEPDHLCIEHRSVKSDPTHALCRAKLAEPRTQRGACLFVMALNAEAALGIKETDDG